MLLVASGIGFLYVLFKKIRAARAAAAEATRSQPSTTPASTTDPPKNDVYLHLAPGAALELQGLKPSQGSAAEVLILKKSLDGIQSSLKSIGDRQQSIEDAIGHQLCPPAPSRDATRVPGWSEEEDAAPPETRHRTSRSPPSEKDSAQPGAKWATTSTRPEGRFYGDSSRVHFSLL
jgi:hypothetical protein